MGNELMRVETWRPAGAKCFSEQRTAVCERMERRIIAQAELAMLVVQHLNETIARQQSFTAYDVTQALRLAHPAVNILHAEVRNVVHRRMHSVVAAQFYRQAMMQFPTGSACCYLPAT